METIKLNNGHTIERTIYSNRSEENEYNENGVLVRSSDGLGSEIFCDTNSAGKPTHMKIIKNGNIIGELWYDRDEKDRVIHYHDTNGEEFYSEYDELDNLIHMTHPVTGLEEWWEYDEDGNLLRFHNSIGTDTQKSM